MSNTQNSFESPECHGLAGRYSSERIRALMFDALEVGPDFFAICPSCAARNVTAGKRRRGRPQVIPDERKAAALKAKETGATNKELASLIYNCRHPTRQQKKNVPAILKHYLHKLNRLSSSVTTA